MIVDPTKNPLDKGTLPKIRRIVRTSKSRQEILKRVNDELGINLLRFMTVQENSNSLDAHVFNEFDVNLKKRWFISAFSICSGLLMIMLFFRYIGGTWWLLASTIANGTFSLGIVLLGGLFIIGMGFVSILDLLPKKLIIRTMVLVVFIALFLLGAIKLRAFEAMYLVGSLMCGFEGTCAAISIIAGGAYLAFLFGLTSEVKLDRLLNNRCTDCGYDLRQSPDRCPECGTVLTD